MSMHEPTPTSVPDDRVHGDAVRGAEPYGDSWLRPTLTTERSGAAPAGAPAGSDGPGRSDSPGRPPAPSARPWWLVAGLGATLALASAAGVTTWGAVTGGPWHSDDEQQTYHRAVTDLTFAGGSSDVEVRGGAPAGTVHVERHLSWGPGASRPTPKETWSGSALTIAADCDGSFLSSCSVDYVVTVPRATDVAVDIGSGDIVLTGSLGAVTLKSGSGDIETANLAAEQVTAEAGSGDIDVELATLASPVSVRTGSGDVSVRLPQDAVYAVATETGSGDTEVSVPTNPDSTSTLRVRTGSGDIAVDRP